MYCCLVVDLVVQAKSGTGKTCVFAVVALENVDVTCSTTQVCSSCNYVTWHWILSRAFLSEGLNLKHSLAQVFRNTLESSGNGLCGWQQPRGSTFYCKHVP